MFLTNSYIGLRQKDSTTMFEVNGEGGIFIYLG